MSFGIRPPLPQDKEALTALASRPDVAHGLGILPLSAPDWVRARLDKAAPSTYALVAVVEGDAVGWVRLVRGIDRKSHSATFELAVRSDFQNKGIGRALLREMLEVADGSLGLRRIELEVFRDNPNAHALYQSEGFEVEGTRRGAVMAGGALVDGLIMARLKAA